MEGVPTFPRMLAVLVALATTTAETKRPPPAPEAPALTQIRLVRPAGMKVSFQGSDGRFDPKTLVTVPTRLNLEQGRRYRLKLADIPDRPGVELYPTIETPKVEKPADDFVRSGSVPIELSKADFEQVAKGNFVVKVAYLPKTDSRKVAILDSYDMPGRDPLEEARRKGTILAVMRMGNIDLEGGTKPTSTDLAKRVDELTRALAEARGRLIKAEKEAASLRALLKKPNDPGKR